MAQLIVRDLEDSVKARLRRRAARHGLSMEEEIRQILRNAINQEESSDFKLGSRIASRFKRAGLTKDLPELRGHRITPADFDK